MQDFFIKWYSTLDGPNSFLRHFPYITSLLRFNLRTVANFSLTIYYLALKWNEKHCIRENINQLESERPRIIVSLTSFPKRINRLWLVIEIILRQSKKPDLVVLWLSKKQVSSLNSLPKRLLKLQECGLKIVFVDEDYRSHKKYYYVLKEYPNDFIITVDDDIFYSKHLIASLWKKHLEFPEAVICNYAFKIERNDDKSNAPYEKWKQIKVETAPSSEIFFGSGGGTLFPPGSLHEDALKPELFLDLCLHADDIWLNTMVRLNNKKIAKDNLNFSTLPLQFKNNITLASINLIGGQNDKQLALVRDYYIQNQNLDPYKSEEQYQ